MPAPIFLPADKRTIALTGVGILLFTLAFARTAWVTEDAFITFRVIDNLIAGHGLVWNLGERVQVFTHPLWLATLALPMTLGADPYYAAITVSLLALLAVLLLFLRIAGTIDAAALAVLAALLASRSFIDYSSSGLENPLVHLLLLIALTVWHGRAGKRLPRLSLLFGLLWLTRPDAILLAAPLLLVLAIGDEEEAGLRRQWPACLVALLPALFWLGFSLLYYGAPVPNTAYAKLGTDIPLPARIASAGDYLAWSAANDPITLLLLIGGLLGGLTGNRHLRPLGAGLALWFAYLFWIGGDYMGGRFLSAPTLLAASIVVQRLRDLRPAGRAVPVMLLLLASMPTLGLTLFSSADFADGRIAPSGIADERGFYYPHLGLLRVRQHGDWRTHPWYRSGLAAAQSPGTIARCTVGLYGYAAGPRVTLIDGLALTDAFLARLPSRQGARTGHFERALPPGFLESRLSGSNRLENPALRSVFDDVTLIERGELLAPERLHAIWRLQFSGAGRIAGSGFDRDAIGLPGIAVETRDRFSCFGVAHGGARSWRLQLDAEGKIRAEPLP